LSDEEFNNPAYQYDDFGDDGLAYRRHGRFANLNPNKRDRFPGPNREARIPYPNHGREGGYPNPQEYRMKVDIPSFSRNLDIESFQIYEVNKFFNIAYVSIKKQVKFVAYKLKGGATAWWDQLQIL